MLEILDSPLSGKSVLAPFIVPDPVVADGMMDCWDIQEEKNVLLFNKFHHAVGLMEKAMPQTVMVICDIFLDFEQ